MKLKSESIEEYNLPTREESFYEKKVLISKLDFIKYTYCEQIKHAEKKIEDNLKNIFISIFFTILLVLFESVFLAYIYDTSKSFLAYSWTSLIIIIVLFIAICQNIFKLIENIYEYNVHKETPSYLKYKLKKNIFTLKDEKKFCLDQVKVLNNLLYNLNNDSDYSYIVFAKNIEYVEHRADTNIFYFFRDYFYLIYGLILLAILATYQYLYILIN